MESTVNKSRGGFFFLPILTGFIFAFRISLTFLWFQDEPLHGTVAFVALSLSLLTLAAMSSIGSVSSVSSSSLFTPPVRWSIAILALSLISLLWSEAPLDASVGYWFSWTADVAAVWLLLRERNAEVQATAIMKGFVCGAVLVAIIAWIIPAMDDLRLGNEDFLHPNALGFLFSIATLLAIHLAHQTTFWRWPAFFLATTLLRTISKSSIFGFLVAFGFYLLWDSTLTRKIKTRIGIAAGIILAFLSGLLQAYFTSYTAGTDPETLTGRTFIWAVSFEYAIKKPLLGYGFYSYRFIIPPLGKFEAQQAHNELLQQFFSFGIVGVILIIGLYWSLFRQIRRAPSSSLKTLTGTLLLFALVHGLTDTQIIDLSYPLWLLTMLSILLSVRTHSSQPAEALHLETSTT
ncbi:O-antigen ligase [Granulicella sp. S190]|uniref:O-antigen ligase family protein n=1 Tax=Granulicella sp. S190 TaxID=1747226 RepID=UPI00131D6F63|nr:O-antigen ligase family protein [Granulicella sp. S190]